MTLAALIPLVAVVLCAQPAAGAGEGGGKAQAQALLDEGAGFYERGDYAAALERFKQAFEKFPSPKLWFNIGQANRDLGRPVEAREAFRRFLADAPDAPADALAEARQSAADLERKLGQLRVTCETAGAEVSVDGRSVGATPLPLPIWTTPGRHQVAVRHGGFVPAIEDAQVAAGQVRAVAVTLRALEPRAPELALDRAAPTDGQRDASRPIYRRAWFWVAVGVVAVAGGLGAAWALRAPEGPSTTLGERDF